MAQKDYPIPNRLNFIIFVVTLLFVLICLTLASTVSSVMALIICGFVFSFVANTVFSLMHEAVHGYLFSDRKVNERAGFILAGFFPTSFTFQRVMHLGHHRRNRTDAEMFDLYYKEDNRYLKWVQLYGIFTGPYWAFVPLSATLVALLPWLRNPNIAKKLNWAWLERTGVFAMMGGLTKVDIRKIQIEVAYAFILHASLFHFLNLSVLGWAVCYLMFAINWGALQYADHAFSVRDIKNGAWNLRVSSLVQLIFLNYHNHLAHHQNPQVPWYYLPQFVRDEEQRPTFWQIFFAMLRGPRLVEREIDLKIDHSLESELRKQAGRS